MTTKALHGMFDCDIRVLVPLAKSMTTKSLITCEEFIYDRHLNFREYGEQYKLCTSKLIWAN